MPLSGPFPQAAHDVLFHDHHIINNEAHGRSHTPQSHDVETQVQHIKEEDGGPQHPGDNDGGDEGHPKIAQKDQ